jgi:hypothetical protein
MNIYVATYVAVIGEELRAIPLYYTLARLDEDQIEVSTDDTIDGASSVYIHVDEYNNVTHAITDIASFACEYEDVHNVFTIPGKG